MQSPAYERFRELLNRRAYAEAAALAEEESVRAGGRDSFWPTQQSRALCSAGEHGAAEEAARLALAAEPGNGYALLALGRALYGAGRFREAVPVLEEARSEERVAARANKGLALSLLKCGRSEEVLQLASAGGLEPADAASYRIKALVALGRRDEALEACHALLKLVPDQPSALWEQVGLEVERDGLEVVLARYGRLAKIPSRPPVYREIYASLCRRAGRVEQASAAYEKLAAEGSEQAPRAQRQRAFTLAKSGREAEAIPIFEEILRGDPADHYVHSAYQAASGRAGRLEEAKAFYEALLEADPGRKNLYGRIKAVEKRIRAAEE